MVLEGRLIIPSWYSTTMMTVLFVSVALLVAHPAKARESFLDLDTYKARPMSESESGSRKQEKEREISSCRPS